MATDIPVRKQGISKREPAIYQNMFADIERLADNWMSPLRLFDSPLLQETLPRCDVIDRDNEVIVRVALPGFKKKDIEVSATDSMLTIQGKTDEETEEGEQEGDYYRKEIRTENFIRTMRLPAVVEDQKAKACFKDGLLEVTLPKSEKEKRHTLKIED